MTFQARPQAIPTKRMTASLANVLLRFRSVSRGVLRHCFRATANVALAQMTSDDRLWSFRSMLDYAGKARNLSDRQIHRPACWKRARVRSDE